MMCGPEELTRTTYASPSLGWHSTTRAISRRSRALVDTLNFGTFRRRPIGGMSKARALCKKPYTGLFAYID
jgi:hypothetical protein